MLLLTHTVATTQSYTAVTLEPDTVELGEPFTAKLEINGVANTNLVESLTWDIKTVHNTLYDSDTNFYEAFADLSIIDAGNYASNFDDKKLSIPKDKLKFQNNYWHTYIKLSCFSPGVFTFNGPIVAFTDSTMSVTSKNYSIYVKAPEGISQQQSSDIADVKDIIEVKTPIIYYLKYVLLAMIMVGLLFIVYKKLKYRKQSSTPVLSETVITTIPAHQKALHALAHLQTKQLWQKGYVKEYQSELTDIIRSYFSDRYDFDAMEMTTSEILNQSNISMLGIEVKDKVQRLLTISDLVKFARSIPDEEMYSSFMQDAIEIVHSTKSLNP
jgi:hypothetical protein